MFIMKSFLFFVIVVRLFNLYDNIYFLLKYYAILISWEINLPDIWVFLHFAIFLTNEEKYVKENIFLERLSFGEKLFFFFKWFITFTFFSAKSLSQYITHEANLITRLLLKDFRGLFVKNTLFPVLVLFFNITRSSYMSCLILHTPCALFISLNMCKTVSVICRSWSKVPIIYCIVTLKTIFDNYKNIFCLQKHLF